MAGTSTKFTEQSEQLVSAAREAAIAEGHCSDQCTLPQMCVWASTHARSESRSDVNGWLGVYADALLDASCGAQRGVGDAHESPRHTVGERAQPSRSEYSTADSHANHGAMGKALAARGENTLALQSFQAAVRGHPSLTVLVLRMCTSS